MITEWFFEKAKEVVAQELDVEKDDVVIVWAAKILRNRKAILFSPECLGILFEVTYDGAENKFYVDKYKKERNFSMEVKYE